MAVPAADYVGLCFPEVVLVEGQVPIFICYMGGRVFDYSVVVFVCMILDVFVVEWARCLWYAQVGVFQRAVRPVLFDEVVYVDGVVSIVFGAWVVD